MSGHLLIQIKNILVQPTLKIKYASKYFMKINKSTLFFINYMFIKLVKLNKLIPNTKFINIMGSGI